MKQLILMVGIPGSGKTSFAASLINMCDNPNEFVYICPDNIREELSGDANNQKISNEAWKLAYSRLEIALSKDNCKVIFDAVLANPGTRKHLVDVAKKYDANVIYIIMSTPLKVALERNKERTRQVPDSIIEDFDKRLNNEFSFLKKDRHEF